MASQFHGGRLVTRLADWDVHRFEGAVRDLISLPGKPGSTWLCGVSHRSDRLFTLPGVAGILIAGFAAAIVARVSILGTGWIFWPIILFSISGLVFGIRIAALQPEIRNAARIADSSGLAWSEYAKQYRAWELWGFIALITPVAALVMMVLKPALSGL
jgi:uncharacterized membrane protein